MGCERFFENGGSPTVEVVHVVEGVVDVTFLMQEVAGVVPATRVAEVEHLPAEFLGNVGEEVFRMAIDLRSNVLSVHKWYFCTRVARGVGQIRGYPPEKYRNFLKGELLTIKGLTPWWRTSGVARVVISKWSGTNPRTRGCLVLF